MSDIVCILSGHPFVNEVQTMAQLFFGHAKVSLIKVPSAVATAGGAIGTPPTDAAPEVVIVTQADDSAVSAAVFINDAKKAAHVIPMRDSGVKAAGLPPRRVLMLAMFHALQGLFPVEAPWGALTGIRPSKMVRGWLEAGRSPTDILACMEKVLRVRGDKARLALEVARAEQRLAARILSRGKTPLGVYIGIPYCPGRCSYCSFNLSHRPPAQEELTRYTNVLIKEIHEKAAEARSLGNILTSVYIGGGTPTVLGDALLAKLLNAVGEAFSPGAACEYTVEAGRADTLSAANLRLMRSYGVNRITVNAQTLNDRTLAAIGRNHSAADFFRAFALAREAGFACINTDLIARLPGEGDADLLRNIEGLLPLAPENITIHTLSVKRASRLNELRTASAGDTPPPGEYPPETAPPPPGHHPSSSAPPPGEVLARAGYAPYYLYRQKNTVGLLENTGYSLPGHECLYNIGMMSEVQTVLGTGAAAVTKYVNGDTITRRFNEKNPQIYMERRT